MWLVRRSRLRQLAADERAATAEAALERARRDAGAVEAELAVERAARSRLEAALLQSDRFEQVGRLTAGLAHDLNNLLTILLGHADVLSAASADEPDLQRELAQLQASIARAARLTGRILSVGKQEPLPPQVVDLNGLVRGLDSLHRKVLGRQVDLVYEFADEPCRVSGDASQLEQVLINLVSNARDAMPDGGRVTISVRGTTLPAEALRREGDPAAGEYVELRVSDTGMGMSDTVKRRLFEPFFTTKVPGKGTGIGLSSSLGIVQRLGGRLTVESAIGAGSTFLIVLPRARAGGAGGVSSSLGVA